MNLRCRLEVIQKANNGNAIFRCLMQHHSQVMMKDCTKILARSANLHNSDVKTIVNS